MHDTTPYIAPAAAAQVSPKQPEHWKIDAETGVIVLGPRPPAEAAMKVTRGPPPAADNVHQFQPRLDDATVKRAEGVPLKTVLDMRGIRLKKRGGEWSGPCPICSGTDRFSINEAKAAWLCRGCDKGGHGALSLLAHIDRLDLNSGPDFRRAVETLTGEQVSRQQRRGANRAQAKEKPGDLWAPQIPAPEDAGRLLQETIDRFAPRGYRHSGERYPYFNTDAGLCFFIVRYVEINPAAGEKPDKQPRPFTFCTHPKDGRQWWLKGMTSALRPLYAIDQLLYRPADPVLIVEGEKTVTAATALFADYAVTTSSHGAKAAKGTDWSLLRGRYVVVWPDNDKDGRTYARDVARLAAEAGAASVRVVSVPDSFKAGWDLADAPPDGIGQPELRALLDSAGEAKQPEAEPAIDEPAGEALDEIEQLIQNGAGTGDAAAALQHVVWVLGRLHDQSLEDILTKLKNFPAGLAAAFGGGLKKALGRAFRQCQRREQQPLLDELNGEWSVVIDGAKTGVLRFNEQDVNGQVHQVSEFLSSAHFQTFYCNRKVWLGPGKYVPLGQWWLQHEARRQYRGLTFEPNAEAGGVIKGRLNLWAGFGIQPVKGSWSLMERHVAETICGGDETQIEYVLNFLIAVQHPAEQGEVALIVIGPKGAGKGSLGNIMCRIFGQHGIHISSPAQLVGKHNAHLRDCVWLFMDEANWTGDRTAQGVLQTLITENSIFVEPKFRDGVMARNRLHVFIAAEPNALVVPAGQAERRYVVIEIPPERAQPPSYFKALHKQMHQDGGDAAMLHDLQRRPLDGFHPRQIIRTDSLLGQQARNLPPLDQWLVEVLDTGVLPGSCKVAPNTAPTNDYEVIIGQRTVTRQGLVSQARDSSPRLRTETEAGLGKYLSELGCVGVRHTPSATGRKRGWRFPLLTEMRAAWVRRYPNWPWRKTNVDPQTGVDLVEWSAEYDDWDEE